MAECHDDVVSEISKYIQGSDHLVIVESYCCSLAEEKDSLFLQQSPYHLAIKAASDY
jgi:hypothetical protein